MIKQRNSPLSIFKTEFTYISSYNFSFNFSFNFF